MTYFQWLPLESRSKEEDHVILAMLLELLKQKAGCGFILRIVTYSLTISAIRWGTGEGHVPPFLPNLMILQ